jgi:hypothetical protein
MLAVADRAKLFGIMAGAVTSAGTDLLEDI